MLQEQAVKLGHTEPVNNIYCIGDNICTDIFGANLYNRYLSDREKDAALLSQANSQVCKKRKIMLTGGEKNLLLNIKMCNKIDMERKDRKYNFKNCKSSGIIFTGIGSFL